MIWRAHMSTSGNPDFYTRPIQRRLRSWALRRDRDGGGVDRVQRADLDTRRPRAIQILAYSIAGLNIKIGPVP